MRLSIAALTILMTTFSGTAVEACWLTDCLFGRRTTPYAVGYAPAVATPYVTAYPPAVVTTTPSVASPATSYRPAYAASAAPATAYRPAYTASGVYQTQRPAYLNNPSVYTGLPVTSARPSYRAAQTGITAPTPATIAPPAQTSYSSNYSAAQASTVTPGQPLQITTPTGTPNSALPATPVAPLFPATPPAVGGLRRFFSSLFGTGYRSSYYRAPVTFYRPVTTVDPVSGATVTYQQPCQAYTQRLQRTPITSFQLGQPAISAPAAANPTMVNPSPYPNSPATCPTPGGVATSGLTQPYPGQSSYPNQSYGTPPGTIGQTSGIAGGQVAPIPSTMSPAPAGNYAPNSYSRGGLNTTPPIGTNPNADRQDLKQMEQPRLESGRPSSSESSPAEPKSEGNPRDNSNSPSPRPLQQRSYWELQNAEDSTAMIRRPPSRYAPTASQSIQPRPSDVRAAEPIRAPDDYVSPFRPQANGSRPAQTRSDTFSAPPLPERSVTDPSELTQTSITTPTTPAREAGWIRTQSERTEQPRTRPALKRDNNWFVDRP